MSQAIDECRILITNPCKAPYQGPYDGPGVVACQNPSMTGYGKITVNEETTDSSLFVDLGHVSAFDRLPATWQNQAWCNVMMVR